MNRLYRLPMAKHAGWWLAVVLLPALIPWLAVCGSLLPLNHGGGKRLVFLVGVFTLSLWWQQAFLGLTKYQGGGREADNFVLSVG